MRSSISIVIPSLGNKSLLNTIKSIQINSVQPFEIIICLPKNIKHNLNFKNNKKIKIIYSSIKNQVAQRIKGFKFAQGKYVLQLDDDILLEKECIKYLYRIINKFDNISVGPILIEKSRRISNFDKKPKNFLYKFYHFVLNGFDGYCSGKISKAGIPYYYNKISDLKKINYVEWLSGGCILHKRSNLVIKNYYNFETSKSYCEDLFHSYYLSKKKIKLIISKRAKCHYYDFSGFSSLGLKNSIVYIKNDFLIRSKFIKLANKSFLRFYFYYVILFIRLIFSLIK